MVRDVGVSLLLTCTPQEEGGKQNQRNYSAKSHRIPPKNTPRHIPGTSLPGIRPQQHEKLLDKKKKGRFREILLFCVILKRSTNYEPRNTRSAWLLLFKPLSPCSHFSLRILPWPVDIHPRNCEVNEISHLKNLGSRVRDPSHDHSARLFKSGANLFKVVGIESNN